MQQLINLSPKDEEQMLSNYGTGADLKWFRNFQLLVNKKFPDYEPEELIEWKERLDKDLQDKGRNFGVEIEKYMKHHVLKTIKDLFKDDWELDN